MRSSCACGAHGAEAECGAAFAKLQVVALIELGLHNPLAVAAAPASIGEVALARKIWPRVPDRSLLIMDRGFGTPSGLHEALATRAGRGVEWLARVRKDIKTVVLERFSDGSAPVEAPAHGADASGKRVKPGMLRMREIRFEVTGRDGKRSAVRLWTGLPDARRYPALETARNYAMRREHEVACRELKLDVRSAELPGSHTLETALQEVMAVVLAMAVVTPDAHCRRRTAGRAHTARKLHDDTPGPEKPPNPPSPSPSPSPSSTCLNGIGPDP